MDDLKRNTFVGVFVLFAILALCWLLTSFGELPALLGKGEYELLIESMDPRGIGEGTSIFLSGVQIGRVKELKFKDPEHLDSGVLIVGAIGQDYIIPKTAWAEVQPAGLGIGRGQINIKVTEGREAEPLPRGEAILGVIGNVWGDLIPATLMDSADRAVAQFGNFVEALTPVANDLHLLLEHHTVEAVDNPVEEARRLTANLSTVIERFDRTLKAINDTFGDPQFKVGWQELVANVKQMSIDGRQALDNINKTTAELRVDLDRISTKFESGIDDVNANINIMADDLRPMLQNSAKLTGVMLRLMTAVERGEGTAGRFMTDAKLYESLLLTSQRLTDMIDTIQRIMAKFERDGAVGIKFRSPIGPISRKIAIPDSAP